MLSLAKGNEALVKFFPKAGSRRARIVNRSATTARLEDLLLTPIPESGWRGQAPTGRLSRVPSTHWSQLMNNDRIKGNWKQLTGKIKAKWGDLTDDDLTVAEGNQEYLVGKLQERYGIAKDEAARQVREFENTL